MAINLSNVNITIQQFQAVATGVYNAGEVHLTSDHSIDKVNHHVGWFFNNDTHYSHAEVLAIKDAFVRALANSGVNADGIANVRRELGLAPNGAKDTDLARRSLKQTGMTTVARRNATILGVVNGTICEARRKITR